MLLKRRHNGTTDLTMNDVADMAREALGDGYQVTVPEQNPLLVGDDRYYRVDVQSAGDDEVHAYHLVVHGDDRGVITDEADVDLREVTFSLNPFRAAMIVDHADLR